MKGNKKLSEEQINKVIDNAKKENDIYYDATRGHFCKIIKELYNPYVQPKFRLMKAYNKINENEIELITKDNVVVSINYDVEIHNSFKLRMSDKPEKSFAANRQFVVIDFIKFFI